ncbi:MAG: hypothetical protein ACYCYP_11490 [Leptospirales bacterium]
MTDPDQSTSKAVDATLVFIKSDPRESPRPAEAVRVTAGLVGGEIPVSVYLFREALPLFEENLEEMEDGEILSKFWGSFPEMGVEIYYEPDPDVQAPAGAHPMSPEELSEHITHFSQFLFF